MPSFRTRRARGALVAIASALVAASLFGAPAQAAPGSAFPAGDSLVFVAQNIPSQLYRAIAENGTVTFEPDGSPATMSYNGIGYNTADNYLYGITGVAVTGFPAASLVRIGEGGVVTRVGTAVFPGGSNSGSIGPNNHLYVTSTNRTSMDVINTTTGALVRNIPVSTPALASDMAYANGFFWALSNGSGTTPSRFVRINATSGAVAMFPSSLPPDAYGAAWTFGNGNLGFAANTSGTVRQISVAQPASAAPVFTVLATSPGPASNANDGAASPGQPTDLSIVKTGPVALVPGGTAAYTVTVTNKGPGNSTGYIVNDVVPAPLTGVTTADDGCSVTGTTVRCVGGRLVAGASQSYTITAAVPVGATGTVANTATATSNEVDPDPGSNSDSSVAGIAGLTMKKNAGVPVDVNGNGLVDAGDAMQYTFDVVNTGEVELAGLAVSDPKAGSVTCDPTTLAAHQGVVCSADDLYTITAADASAGAANNTATVTGTTPDGDDITPPPSSTSTPVTTDAPAITVVKTADVATRTTAGQEIVYSFLVTNSGNVALADVTVEDVDFSGAGALPAIVCPADAARLVPSAQVTCTASYVVTQADVDAGTLTNTATATGNPPAGFPPAAPPSRTVVDLPPAPAVTLVKTASPSLVTAAGQIVGYAFLVTNTGNVTLSGVAVTETAFSGSGGTPAVSCPQPPRPLAPAAAITCTADYTVTEADLDAGRFANTAVAEGTPPAGPSAVSDPSSAEVVVFTVRLPLTGGTGTDQLLAAGGGAVLIALVAAVWHHRRTRRPRRRPRPRALGTTASGEYESGAAGG